MAVFRENTLSVVASKYKDDLLKLKMIADHEEYGLNKRFVDARRPVLALILAVASGEPLLLIGSPGTGKSRLIRAFCGQIGLLNEDRIEDDHPDYFEYLLTPFTEPSELFGYYNVLKAKDEGKLVRETKGMMQEAKVVYLDEVFNGSSAILNSILTFLNERIFHDRGVRVKVKLQCLFAASNRVPEDRSELRAIFDRFVLRCVVSNIGEHRDITTLSTELNRLLSVGWKETYGTHTQPSEFKDLLSQMKKLHDEVKQGIDSNSLVPESGQASDPFYRSLAAIVSLARERNVSQMSNRRLIKMLHIMLIHALYRTVTLPDSKPPYRVTLGPEELKLIPRYFLDYYDEDTTLAMERLAEQLYQKTA